jgi:hypothetical protein
VSGSTKRRYCKLLHQITNHDLLFLSDNQEDSLTFGQLEQVPASLTLGLHKLVL